MVLCVTITPVMFVDPWGLSTTPPGDMDWNGDGIVDTKRDRQRFDSNNNNQADWIEDGYDNATDWYADKTYNVLENFPHVYQTWKYNLCWAADSSMVIEWFTEVKFDFVQIARIEWGNKLYNQGIGLGKMVSHIKKWGYLKEVGYEPILMNARGNSEPITAEFIKNEIDNGRPMILGIQDHAVVIVGYDYNDPNNLQVIYQDSASISLYDGRESVADIMNKDYDCPIIAFKKMD